jgi:lipopolysaccharide export system protein LptA
MPLALAILLLAVIPAMATAQQKEGGPKKRRIELLHADVLEYDESLGNKARRLIGNVSFLHEGAVMDCDSAYLYGNNSLDAFSRVKVNKGDSITLTCEKLNYDGNTEFAKARRKVRLEDRKITVISDALDYDMDRDQAWYLDHGTVLNAENTLTSRIGFYFSDLEEAYFEDSVKLVNSRYTLWADTLRYNARTEVAFFLGPTRIESKENTVHCTRGWYDTDRDISQFSERPIMLSPDQSIIADSIYYNKNYGYGHAIGNVEVADTSEQVLLTGGRAKYLEKGSVVLMTDSALMVQDMSGDSLFLHADTLLSIVDTVIDIRILFAFHRTKFFKSDMQGKCDSLVYSYVDSTIRLYRDPIIWSEENQLTSDSTWIQMRNGKADRLYMKRNAMIISEEDSAMALFNQIKGREMVGHFRNGRLDRVYVDGDGETVYYGSEEGTEPENVNIAKSSSLVIRMDGSKVQQITFFTQPDATLYPMDDPKAKDMRLEGFRWRQDERPMSIEDIFIWDTTTKSKQQP